MRDGLAAARIAGGGDDRSAQRTFARTDRHHCTERVSFQRGVHDTDREPMTAFGGVIAIETRDAAGIGHQHVQVAVAVDVAERQAT